MEKGVQENWQTLKITHEENFLFEDTIARETPITLIVNGTEFATIVCSPTNVDELAIGFLATEGVILQATDIKSMQTDEKRGFVYVELTKALNLEVADHSKRVIGSCCGKSRQFYFKSDQRTAKTIMTHTSITPTQIFHLMKTMQKASTDFQATGGVHNAALGTVDDVLITRTDIGRHNALDKIYGHMLQAQISARNKVIVFSGRISSEVLLKISKMGIGIIISTSAPTDLALSLADDLGITAIGFVRGDKMNVYTHQSRVNLA
ncbi:MAG TPA: formate dehydrogenase accessory sulfurtransferase FdhD [Pseudogracilibacillus sp.]|nr:formate dehydrogenase accessory sulfurtransferase FdhD [Pseudogracilibacillus sp.]